MLNQRRFVHAYEVIASISNKRSGKHFLEQRLHTSIIPYSKTILNSDDRKVFRQQNCDSVRSINNLKNNKAVEKNPGKT